MINREAPLVTIAGQMSLYRHFDPNLGPHHDQCTV